MAFKPVTLTVTFYNEDHALAPAEVVKAIEDFTGDLRRMTVTRADEAHGSLGRGDQA